MTPSGSTRRRETAEHALTLDATDASAHVALAKVQHQTGQIDEAIRELRLAVQLVPDSDDAHRLLGRFLAESGNTAEGVQELQRAISLRPGFWTNHYTWDSCATGRVATRMPSRVSCG